MTSLACVLISATASHARADACVVTVRGTLPYVRVSPGGAGATVPRLDPGPMAFRLADAVARIELGAQPGDGASVRVSAPLELTSVIPPAEQRFALARDIVVGRRRLAAHEWTVDAPHGDASHIRAALVRGDGERIADAALSCDAVGPLVAHYDGEPSCNMIDPLSERRGTHEWWPSVELPIGTPLFDALSAQTRWATVSRPLGARAIHSRGARRTPLIVRSMTPCTGWNGVWVDVDAEGVGRVVRGGLDLRGGGIDAIDSPARVLDVAPGTVFSRAGLRARDEILAVALPHARRPAFNLYPTELRNWLGWGATLQVRRAGRVLTVTIARAPGCPTHPDEPAHGCVPW